ncbi:hypothetical protein SAMN05428988_1359 [Chitinophaga sp. YR573]|uniref:DUF3108 domain-containing protein n=1 Tax=Chitinophaga sp. YR573 TaxID=1881040 RepID=UPI0008D81C2D|nr:hypothetical protein [Chitinophaga sp. YR573]SEW02401.1 hypothetical protein SAMN05428988_1359 [Chitinophaga sp. YR573]
MNRTIARILILFCVMLRFSFYPLLYAQSILRPGDKTINYALLKSCSNTYKGIIYDSLGKTVMEIMIIDVITIDTVKGLLTRSQHQYFPGDFERYDSTIADLKTLSPVRMRMVTNPPVMQMDLAFKDLAVHAVVHKNNTYIDTTHKIEAGYFDSNLFQYFLGFLPYKEGFSAAINLYTYEKGGVDPHNVAYMGEDILPGSTRYSHIVKTTRESDNKKVTEYSWYDSLTGILVHFVMPFRNGLFVMNKI